MMRNTAEAQIKHYFEYPSQSESDVEDFSFGEYLVRTKKISRFDLFRALRFQDEHPGVRVGECIAALGLMNYSMVKSHLRAWRSITIATL